VALAQDFIGVAALDFVVNLTEIQRPGGKRLPAQAVLQGLPLAVGEVLGGPLEQRVGS